MDRRRFIITTAGVTAGTAAGIKKYADSAQPVLAVESPKIDTTKLEKSEKMSPRQEQVIPFNKIEINGKNIDGDLTVTTQVVREADDLGVDPLDNHTEIITPSSNSFTEEVGGFDMRIPGSEIDQTTQFEILINVESTENSIDKTLRSDPFQISVLTDLDIKITQVNSPVYSGNTLTVDVEVFNNGNQQRTETILLDVNGNEVDSTSLTVGSTSIANRTEAKTLEWSTDGGDLGEYPISVRIEDEQTTQNINVADPPTDILYNSGNTVYFNSLSSNLPEYKFTEVSESSFGERGINSMDRSDSYFGYAEDGGFGSSAVYLHNLSDRSLKHKFSVSDSQYGMGINETYFAYGGDSVQIRNISDGSIEYEYTDVQNVIWGVEVTDSHIVYGGDGGKAYVRTLSDGNLKYTFTESSEVVVNEDLNTTSKRVHGVAITDTHIAYCCSDGNAYVHNMSDGSLEYTLSEAQDQVRAIEMTDSRIIYGGHGTNAYVHNLSDGTLEYTFTQPNDQILDASFSNTYVSYCVKNEGTYVHNLSDGTLSHRFEKSGGYGMSVDLDPSV